MATLTLISRPEVGTAIVTAVRNGVPITRAARMAGINWETVRQWESVANGAQIWPGTDRPVSEEARERIVSFLGEVARARDECAARMVQSIQQAGFQVGKGGGIDWRAHAWLLNNHPSYREEWHEHRELSVEHTGSVAHEHRIARGATTVDLANTLDVTPWDALEANADEES